MIKNKIQILIADDSTMGREGLTRIFETADDIEVIGECKTAVEILRQIQETSPDILIIDLSYYGDHSAGSEAIKEIKEFNSDIGIIAITAYPLLISDAKKAGADVVISRIFESDNFIDMIRELSKREKKKPNRELSTKKSFEALTNRELDVLKLLMEGLTDKEIAKELVVADSTAKNHVSNIISKLNARNRTEVTKKAYDYKLLDKLDG